METKPVQLSEKQSTGEEIANSIIHGIGAVLSIAGLVIIIVIASKKGGALRITTLSIYGASMIIMFLMSTMSHGLVTVRAKNVFEILDHSAVYTLIAGTYTPICLIIVGGAWGWTFFGIAWGLAILGIIFKVFFTGRYIKMSSAIYVVMGWLVLAAIWPVINGIPKEFLLWLLAGGLLYTFGVIFYVWRKIPYHHAVWHVFVLGAAVCHFFGILLFVA